MSHAQISERGSLAYRADIDGLRALAVVPVVLYHFHVAPFTGGYVGVDVFFVISGFLITGLIHAEMRTGEYSLAGFYERRARRILPALFLVIAAAALASWWLLFPYDLKRFGESTAATALFISNFDPWQHADYFDPLAETKPLLHTWSLAVEEQFYLLFPLLLTLVRAAGRRGALLLSSGLALASFAFGVWAVRHHESLAFYLAPARIWELMLGAALALADLPRAARRLGEALSLAGLAMLALAFFAFSPTTLFPGENALLPCLGAALLIYANQGGETIAARVLSWRPVVFIGLISYSLYLWHWPIYVFASYTSMGPPGPLATAAYIALSVGLAVLSWQFWERPFRDRRRFSRRRIFLLSGTSIAAALALGAALFFGAGFPQRFSPHVQRVLQAVDDLDPREKICGRAKGKDLDKRYYCSIGAADVKPSFALWGDSHAAALISVVSATAARHGRAGVYIGVAGCAPLLGVKFATSDWGRCARINTLALALIAKLEVRDVIVAGRWAYYDTGYGVANSISRRQLTDSLAARSDDQHIVFARGLERAVARLRAGGRHVILVADVPETRFDIPQALARQMMGGLSVEIRTNMGAYRARQSRVLEDLWDLHRRYGATVLEPANILCAGGPCAINQGDHPFYRDSHHLTTAGAARLAPLFDGIFVRTE